MNIYDFSVPGQDGSMISLSQYRGKVLLILNSATGCGFTPQYEELEQLYTTHKEQGFEILDFPCNQFGSQAPGTDEEIHSFCTLKYGVSFPQFSKCLVTGEQALPLFSWLTAQAPFTGFDKTPMGLMLAGMIKKSDPYYKSSPDIKWNFTKFILDREGQVIARFEPTASMKKVGECIKSLL